MIDEHKRILLVIPHEDDGEGGCGGSVAGWAQKGADITFLLCTNGDKGSSDPYMTSEKLASIRAEEQAQAAAILGVNEVVRLDYSDGERTKRKPRWVLIDRRHLKCVGCSVVLGIGRRNDG